MRRISTVSAESGRSLRRGMRPQSAASWSWYSNSEVDLILMSRNRANSFELAAPHPSTMLKAIDSAALTICDLRDPRSLRGNPRIVRRTPRTSSWALCHTSNRRKSCIGTFCELPGQTRRPFSAPLPKSLPSPLLTTTDNCSTDQLITQNLHPLRPGEDLPPGDFARMH